MARSPGTSVYLIPGHLEFAPPPFRDTELVHPAVTRDPICPSRFRMAAVFGPRRSVSETYCRDQNIDLCCLDQMSEASISVGPGCPLSLVRPLSSSSRDLTAEHRPFSLFPRHGVSSARFARIISYAVGLSLTAPGPRQLSGSGRRPNHVTIPPPRVQPSRRLDHRPTAAQSPLSDNGTGRESGAAARPQSPDGAACRSAGRRVSSAGPPVSRGGEWQGGRSGSCRDLAGRGGEYDVALAERTEPSVDLI